MAFEPLCSRIWVVLDDMGEAGELSLIGVAFEPLCSQIWVVLGGVGEAG